VARIKADCSAPVLRSQWTVPDALLAEQEEMRNEFEEDTGSQPVLL
jgi:hypothetical protein